MAPFSLSCCLLFLGFWVGGVETMSGELLVLVKSQVYERLYYFSAAWGRALCIFFLMSIGAKWLFPLKYLSHYISSTSPFRSVGVWCVFLRFKATTGVCSPALIVGQGFICLFEQTLNCAFSDVTHSAKTCSVLRSVVVASFFILLFGLLSSDCIWKWCHRSVPIVCAVLVNRRFVSLTASVWDWCFRR